MGSETTESYSGHVLRSLFLVFLVVVRLLLVAHNGNQLKIASAKKKFRSPKKQRQAHERENTESQD